MSPDEVRNLTNREKLFIRKEFENKIVRDTAFIAKAVNNAVANAFRKKSKSTIPLWKKTKKAVYFDVQEAKAQMARIKETDNRSWYKKIMRK